MKNRPPDFRRLKELSLTQAVEFLSELPPAKWERGEMRFPCPACGEDSRGRALAVHPSDGFSCWFGSQGQKPSYSGDDAVSLVAHVRSIRQSDAARLLEDYFFRDRRDAPRAQKAPSPAKAELDGRREGMQELDYLEPQHSVAQDILGLSAATLEALGGGYAPKGTLPRRILIPLRMRDGTLVGYCGIATEATQEPLLAFPKNLEERCTAHKAAEQPKPVGAADDLRKRFRVVA